MNNAQYLLLIFDSVEKKVFAFQIDFALQKVSDCFSFMNRYCFIFSWEAFISVFTNLFCLMVFYNLKQLYFDRTLIKSFHEI